MAHGNNVEWQFQAEYDRLHRILSHAGSGPDWWYQKYVEYRRDLDGPPLPPAMVKRTPEYYGRFWRPGGGGYAEALRRLRELVDAIPLEAWPPEDRKLVVDRDAVSGRRFRLWGTWSARKRNLEGPSGEQLKRERDELMAQGMRKTPANKQVAEKYNLPLTTLRDRIAKVVTQSTDSLRS
jgi:hypothetical protein